MHAETKGTAVRLGAAAASFIMQRQVLYLAVHLEQRAETQTPLLASAGTSNLKSTAAGHSASQLGSHMPVSPLPAAQHTHNHS